MPLTGLARPLEDNDVYRSAQAIRNDRTHGLGRCDERGRIANTVAAVVALLLDLKKRQPAVVQALGNHQLMRPSLDREVDSRQIVLGDVREVIEGCQQRLRMRFTVLDVTWMS